MGNARILLLAAGALIALILGAAPPTGPTRALAVAVNDNLANAITVNTPAVSGIVATADLSGATLESGEPSSFASGICKAFATTTLDRSVWYNWTSPATPGTVVFDTFGSDFNSNLAIYTGTAVNSLTRLACSDDQISSNGAIEFSYAASTLYRIQVGRVSGSSNTSAALSITTGAWIGVDTTADVVGPGDINDFVVSLREAILFGSGNLGRGLGALESIRVLNDGAGGAAGSDMIRFSTSVFLPGTIAPTTPLPGIGPNDTVSGLSASPTIDGVTSAFDCFQLFDSGAAIEGLRIRRCRYGVLVFGNNNRLGGATIASQRLTVTESNTGIRLDGGTGGGDGNLVIGSYIGTDGASPLANVTGVAVVAAASGNVVGGTGADDGNVISGNTIGVRIDGANTMFNTVLGNRVGTNFTGATALANNEGVLLTGSAYGNTIGGLAPGAGNLVSGNIYGIQIENGAHLNSALGNKIGTDLSGNNPLPNTSDGVYILDAYENHIGGPDADQANVIAFNGARGVVVDGGAAYKNSIRGNSIHDNASLGIELINSGNAAISAPTIHSIAAANVNGITCANCTVDIYNDASNEGRLYIGSGVADAGGVFSVATGARPLPQVSATVTDTVGNTSQFTSTGAPPNSDGDGLTDNLDACALVPEDVDGYQDGDGCPDTDNDVDGVCDAGQTSVSCTGSDSGKRCFDPAGTLSCPTQDCRNVAEDVDAFKDGDGCPEPDNDNDGQADGDDDCDGTDAQAGVDGMLGSPQDLNHNGIQNGAEGTLTSDDVVLTFEDYDLVLDGDGCHDSPGEDFDGDGYTDDNEALFIGTNAGYPCGINGWPSNLNDAGFSANALDILDVTSFVAPVRRFDKSPGDPGFSVRWDIKPGPTGFPKYINITDVTTLVAGPTGNPPMLNGARAFGKDCPLPPG